MASDLQALANHLGQEPFNRKVSILDLDALNGNDALKFLHGIISSLDFVGVDDFRDNDIQNAVMQIFGFLRVVRYPLPENPNEKANWRQEFSDGKRRVIIPILDWIVRNLDMVKQRNYLSKYLLKVDVPPELRADAEISQMCDEQEQAIQQFIGIHKQYTSSKSVVNEADLLRQEIEDLKASKEQAERRIGELLRHFHGNTLPGQSEEMDKRMVLARNLREQRRISMQLIQKRSELQQTAPTQTQQISRLRDYLNKMTNDWLEMTPEKLLGRLEDRLNIQRRAITETLPKSIDSEKAVISELDDLLQSSEFSERNLNELRIKAQMLQTEIFNLSDKIKETAYGPAQPQMSLLRKQAETLDERKRDVASKNDVLYEQIRQLEKTLKFQRSGEIGVDGDDLSISRTWMKNKEEYDRKQIQLNHLATEKQNLIRTNLILNEEIEKVEKVLNEWEKRTGISPFKSTVTGVTSRSDSKTASKPDLMALANQVNQLEKLVSEKKVETSEIVATMQPLRQQHKIQHDVFETEKRRFDGDAKNKTDGIDSKEKQIADLREQIADFETKFVADQCEVQYLELLCGRVDDPKKGEIALKTLADALKNEQNQLTRLQDELAQLETSREASTHQVAAWQTLDRLFDMKTEHVRSSLANSRKQSTVNAFLSKDHIVMN